MHVYSNIIMHSVPNPNNICFFFFVFFLKKKKQLAAWHIDTWLTYSHVPKLHVAVWPRTLEQVATWPHVNNPHGHVDTCNKYTCPNGHMY
jgi:hypothetical protein